MAMNSRLLRPRASGFNPKSIANLAAWFDATDTSTLSQTTNGATAVTANDNPVGYWRCKITGAAMTQATDANRPLWKSSAIGSRSGLEFDGSGDNLFTTAASLMGIARNVAGVTHFTVLKIDDNSVSRAYWHLGIGAVSNFFRARVNLSATIGNIAIGGRRLDADSVQTVSGAASTNTPYIVRGTVNYASASASSHLNGASLATSSSFQTAGNTSDTASSYWMIGTQFNDDAFSVLATSFDGIMCEVLFYNRVLTAAECSSVERYLGSKYGIAVA